MAKEIVSDELMEQIEMDSAMIEDVIDGIIKEYSQELDDYVAFIKNVLADDEKPPTDTELNDFAMNLSTLIYYTSVGCEQLGIRNDIANSAYKEAFNIARNEIDKGTVADKNVQAELQARQERIVAIIFEKSYKILKAKTESATELLSVVKKVITKRISDNDLSRMQVNN